jgi:hypothetical protein
MRPIPAWWENKVSLTSDPVSPDARFVAIQSQIKRTDGKKGVNPRISFYDLTTHAATDAKPGVEEFAFMGWHRFGGESGAVKGIIRTGRLYEHDKPHEYLLVDPATGACERAPAAAGLADDTKLSPDGKLRMTLIPRQRIDVTDLAAGTTRSFTVHEDDRRFADRGMIDWLGPSYLRFDTIRDGFIDVRTMKLSYLPDQDKRAYFEFSPDFRWTMQMKNETLQIGRVVTP